MSRQTKLNGQKQLIFAAIATFAFLFAAYSDVAAQNDIQYDVLYECPRSPHNFKVLNCPNEKYCEALGVNKYTPSASYKFEINKSSLIDVFKQGGCTVGGKPLEWGIDTTPPKNKPQAEEPRRAGNNPAQTGRFKLGDRVKACPMQMENCNDYWENCTVVKDYMVTEGADAYQVLCDDPKGGKGTLANVPPKFIRAGAPPPPGTPDCPFNEPPGTVSRASKPSAALFKRVIYEWKVATSNGRKVGVTFQSFQMGRSYRNVVLTIPGLGAQLKHTGAPLGATIFELKTTYLFCDRYTDSTIRWLVESQFACFKNRDGDWVCPVDSVPKYREQIYLPNK